MNGIFAQLVSYSLRHRLLVICLLVLITAMASVGHFRPQWVVGRLDDQEFAKTGAQEKAREKPAEEVPANVQPISLSNSDAVIVVESPSFFTSQGAEAMRAVVDALEDLPQVRDVLWMDRVPVLNIFGLPEPILPSPSAAETRFTASKDKAQQHPLVAGQLLSDDCQTMLLLVGLDFYHVFNDADATSSLRDTAAKAAAKFPDVELKFRVTGRLPSTISAIAAHEANQVKYQVIGYGMTLLMTLILFRGLRAVIIVTLAPVMGVYWTLGFIQFLNYDNPLVDVILPVLVSLVGLTDGVHLMVQIRKLRAAGCEPAEAAEQGLKLVGLACFLTSLTTAVGFGSLMLADSRWVQEFGLCSTIGVALCFIAVVTVIPLACTTWLGNRVHEGLESSLIDHHLGRVRGLIDFVLRYPVAIAFVGIFGTIACVAISCTLRPDQRQTDGLPQDAESTQAMLHVDQAFGGLEFSEVTVNWDQSVESDSPQVLEVITAIDELLRREPLLGHPLSIRNLIDAQPGSGPLAERMSLLNLLPPPLKRAFYTPETRRAEISFRVQDLGIATYGPVFERVEQGLRQIEAEQPGFQLKLTGKAVARWRNLYQIVVDLAASLGSAAVIIFVILTIVYRSLRLGLISIVPNLFPLALTGTYLVVAGYNLEIVMVCNFTVCLGIAVDDTIHFLTRFREERLLTDNVEEAIRRSFTGVGTALIMTTMVLVAGFSIVAFSDSRDHQIFATMGAITIAAALFCDLIFLPALLRLFSESARP
jgi:predicted RND superfamily exporter protein